VWDDIRSYLADDTGELETEGQFLGIFDGEIMAGAFLIKPWSAYCYELHGGVLKKYWGKGPEICAMAGRTVFYSSPCLKLVAIVPEFNRPMRSCVQKAGMKQEGIVKNSYLKWSRLHDQYVYGVTRTEMRQIPVKGES